MALVELQARNRQRQFQQEQDRLKLAGKQAFANGMVQGFNTLAQTGETAMKTAVNIATDKLDKTYEDTLSQKIDQETTKKLEDVGNGIYSTQDEDVAEYEKYIKNEFDVFESNLKGMQKMVFRSKRDELAQKYKNQFIADYSKAFKIGEGKNVDVNFASEIARAQKGEKPDYTMISKYIGDDFVPIEVEETKNYDNVNTITDLVNQNGLSLEEAIVQTIGKDGYEKLASKYKDSDNPAIDVYTELSDLHDIEEPKAIYNALEQLYYAKYCYDYGNPENAKKYLELNKGDILEETYTNILNTQVTENAKDPNADYSNLFKRITTDQYNPATGEKFTLQEASRLNKLGDTLVEDLKTAEKDNLYSIVGTDDFSTFWKGLNESDGGFFEDDIQAMKERFNLSDRALQAYFPDWYDGINKTAEYNENLRLRKSITVEELTGEQLVENNKARARGGSYSLEYSLKFPEGMDISAIEEAYGGAQNLAKEVIAAENKNYRTAQLPNNIGLEIYDCVETFNTDLSMSNWDRTEYSRIAIEGFNDTKGALGLCDDYITANMELIEKKGLTEYLDEYRLEKDSFAKFQIGCGILSMLEDNGEKFSITNENGDKFESVQELENFFELVGKEACKTYLKSQVEVWGARNDTEIKDVDSFIDSEIKSFTGSINDLNYKNAQEGTGRVKKSLAGHTFTDWVDKLLTGELDYQAIYAQAKGDVYTDETTLNQLAGLSVVDIVALKTGNDNQQFKSELNGIITRTLGSKRTSEMESMVGQILIDELVNGQKKGATKADILAGFEEKCLKFQSSLTEQYLNDAESSSKNKYLIAENGTGSSEYTNIIMNDSQWCDDFALQFGVTASVADFYNYTTSDLSNPSFMAQEHLLGNRADREYSEEEYMAMALYGACRTYNVALVMDFENPSDCFTQIDTMLENNDISPETFNFITSAASGVYQMSKTFRGLHEAGADFEVPEIQSDGSIIIDKNTKLVLNKKENGTSYILQIDGVPYCNDIVGLLVGGKGSEQEQVLSGISKQIEKQIAEKFKGSYYSTNPEVIMQYADSLVKNNEAYKAYAKCFEVFGLTPNYSYEVNVSGQYGSNYVPNVDSKLTAVDSDTSSTQIKDNGFVRGEVDTDSLGKKTYKDRRTILRNKGYYRFSEAYANKYEDGEGNSYYTKDGKVYTEDEYFDKFLKLDGYTQTTDDFGNKIFIDKNGKKYTKNEYVVMAESRNKK